MASIRLTQNANQGRQMNFSAPSQMQSPGELKPGKVYSAAEMLEPRPGVRGLVPVGTDTNTPGFVQDKARSNNNRMRMAT